MTADLGPASAAAMSFGALLRRLRQAREGPFTRNYGNRYETVFRELSQNELGRRAGLNPSAINHIEHDRYRAQPKRATVENLADALELSESERAALLVAAGYWPWTDLDQDRTAIVLAVALGVVAGDYRRVVPPDPHKTG